MARSYCLCLQNHYAAFFSLFFFWMFFRYVNQMWCDVKNVLVWCIENDVSIANGSNTTTYTVNEWSTPSHIVALWLLCSYVIWYRFQFNIYIRRPFYFGKLQIQQKSQVFHVLIWSSMEFSWILFAFIHKQLSIERIRKYLHIFFLDTLSKRYRCASSSCSI